MPGTPSVFDAIRRLAAALVLAAAGATSGAAQTAAPAAVVRGDSAAVLRARADSARLPWTAADVRFMSSMIGHHTQAITMSRLAPARAAAPSVRTLAERIINAQQDEIAIMQQWLRDRRQPVPPGPAAPDDEHAEHMAGHTAPGAPGSAPAHAGAQHAGAHASMPGMLTAEQMARLERARGAEFDRLFLTSMIQHHRGAVAMVEGLFGTYGAGQDELVFKFASDVNVDQTTEIARMRRMLVALVLDDPAGRGPS